MAIQANKSHKKKKRISKHVLEAEEKKRREKEGVGMADGLIRRGGAQRKEVNENKQRGGTATKMKDPKEVEAYLSNWKDDRSSWKYNKNTQSWLLRHMYEGEKVSKATFTILLEYLQSIKGEAAISRVRQDAIRRAMRYKKYLKDLQLQSQNGHEGGEIDILKDADCTLPLKKDTLINSDASNLLSTDELKADAVRWSTLDEHQKRKEYKRARKILDAWKGHESGNDSRVPP
jgi:hypothetical protein